MAQIFFPRWPNTCPPEMLRAWSKHTESNGNIPNYCKVAPELCLYNFKRLLFMLQILHSSRLIMYQYSAFLYEVIGMLLKVVSKGKINLWYFPVHHPVLSSKWISCLEKCQVDGPGTGVLLSSTITYSSSRTKALSILIPDRTSSNCTDFKWQAL